MKEKQLKTKSGLSIWSVILILVAIVAIISISMFAYAKYIAKRDGTATAQIAEFNFTVTGKSYAVENGIIFATTRKDKNTKVAQDMLAPGTYGEIPINIDATGTQTYVEYTISIALENKPENLKLYYDEERTLEIGVNQIDHYNSEFSRKGFLSFADNDLVRTEYIYWDWPLETGETKIDIRDNDIRDSAWMDTIMTMSISVKGVQVAEKPMYYAANYGDVVNYTKNGRTIRGVVVNKVADVVEIMPVITAEDNPEDESMIGKAITVGNVHLGYNDETTDMEQRRTEAISSYNNAIKEMNIAARNGYDGATRALRAEDVNNLTGFTPDSGAHSKEYSAEPSTENIQKFIVDDLTKVVTTNNETIDAIELEGISIGDTITIGETYGGKTIQVVRMRTTGGKTTNFNYTYYASEYPLLTFYFHNSFFLASRCLAIFNEQNTCHFNIRFYNSNEKKIQGVGIYYASGTPLRMTFPVIPVVSVLSDSKAQYDKENDEWNVN